MKRHLAGEVNPPRRHETEPRCGQGLVERLPRWWISIYHPSIGRVALLRIFFLDTRDIVNRHGASLARPPVRGYSVRLIVPHPPPPYQQNSAADGPSLTGSKGLV